MGEVECFECNDRGFIFDANTKRYVRCKCQMVKALKAFLAEFDGYKFSTEIAKNSKAYTKDWLFRSKNHPYDSFCRVVKTLLSIMWLDNQNIKFLAVSGRDIIDSVFLTNERGGSEGQVLYDTDVLILKLGRDSANKLFPDTLLNLLTSRAEHKKLTWIYIYPEVTDARLREYYGDQVTNIILAYTSIVK